MSPLRKKIITASATCVGAALAVSGGIALTGQGAGAAGIAGITHHSTVQKHDPLGYLDHIAVSRNSVTLTGWTFDPDAVSQPIKVAVRVDGNLAVTARASHARPDVSRHYHRTVTTPGYVVSFKASYATHKVCVYGLNIGRGTTTRLTCQSITVRNSSRGQRIAAMAKTFVGRVPYVSAGTSPSTGFDCSGLTRYVYGRQHISLVHSADAQYRHFKKISRSSARPGDLVFFLSGGRAYHVAVYEGKNMIVAAATYGEGVKYQKIWSSSVRFGTVLR